MHYFVIILNSIVQNYSVFLITSPETIFLITLSPSYRLENISTVIFMTLSMPSYTFHTVV